MREYGGADADFIPVYQIAIMAENLNKTDYHFALIINKPHNVVIKWTCRKTVLVMDPNEAIGKSITMF